MGGFHRRVLRDLGLDVTTVDPDPATGADHIAVPSRRFDVVCIAAPIDHLADEAARWIGHEGWLLVEKPFAGTLTDAQVLADELAGQRVGVGYVERFNPQVRYLQSLLYRMPVEHVVFYRHNLRTSQDVRIDLTSHDVDLAAYLGLTCKVSYDSQAGVKQDRVVWVNETLAVDLMAHDTSPLHAQWHAFLSGRPGYATPLDAVHVLAALDHMSVLAVA